MSTVTVLALFLSNWAMGEPVTGYSTYVRLLPGGKDKQNSNFNLIASAQEEVRTIEAEKRKREIKFDRPVDIYHLNANYTMISFEVLYRPMENSRFSDNPAIFALLFEGTNNTGLTHYTARYIKWIGSTDIDEYKASQISDFCGYFRRAGVEDCIPDTGVETPVEEAVTAKPAAKSQRPIKAKEDIASTGIVKESLIDPAISRKKDVDKVGKMVGENSKKIDSLSSELKSVKDDAVHMSTQIKGVDQKVSDLSDLMVQQQKAQAVQEVPPSFAQFKALEEKIENQVGQIQDLNKKIAALEALLQGLSRNGNTLRLTEANLQIVNGTGMTKGINNGTGNLIIGYNEAKSGEPLQPTSHQIILPEGEKMTIPIESHDAVPQHTETKGFKGRCFIETLWE